MVNIKQELELLSDEKYREFNKNLCPDSKRKMFGIRIPILRNFAKNLLKEYSLDEILQNIDTEYFEEVIVRGFCIGSAKIDLKEKIKYIDDFVPLIDSWAISDSFVPALKIKKDDLEFYFEYIQKYLDSDKEFDIRFAVISFLDYFIIDEYIDIIIDKLNKIFHEGYYVKMAVAWCLCEIGIKYNDKFLTYMKSNENNLDKFTFNKTLQKMIESYRVSDKQKEELRMMKRKD